jgi:hypothetical protein
MTVLLLIIGIISLSLVYMFTEDTSASPPEKSVVKAAPASAPAAILKPVVTFKGRPVDPFDFLDEATPSNVVAFFSEEPDYSTPGLAYIPITLNDGKSRGDVNVSLYILDVAKVVRREAGTQHAPLTAEDFIIGADILPSGVTYEAELVTDLSKADFYETGSYNVELIVDGARVDSTLALVDTTAPSATVVSMSVNLGTEVFPADFVKDVVDASPVEVSFVAAPDIFTAGEQPVTVALTDDYGNTINLKAILEIFPNIEPPRFSGLRDMEALLNDPVMYRKNVTALDSFGNELEYDVDSSAVDITTPGDYPVTYTVTDYMGREISQSINLKVVNVSEDAITDKLDAVMSQLITDTQTQREKARAIFDWIRSHVEYTSDGPKDSVYEGAYRALQYGQGDCFTFYAIAEVMLTKAGIPNEQVTRVESTTRHYWNLVNCDDNGWLHGASTPTNARSGVSGDDRFLFTDSSAAAFTERIRANTGARDYYTYDKSLHPEVIQ